MKYDASAFLQKLRVEKNRWDLMRLEKMIWHREEFTATKYCKRFQKQHEDVMPLVLI